MADGDQPPRRFQLACAIDGVQVLADVEVDDEQVTITPIPGQPALEVPLAGWLQLQMRVTIAAHRHPT